MGYQAMVLAAWYPGGAVQQSHHEFYSAASSVDVYTHSLPVPPMTIVSAAEETNCASPLSPLIWDRYPISDHMVLPPMRIQDAVECRLPVRKVGSLNPI